MTHMCPEKCARLEVRWRSLHHYIWVKAKKPLFSIAEGLMSNRGGTTAGKTYWLSVGVVLFDTSWLEGAVSKGGS
jgi:hypothetical protein